MASIQGLPPSSYPSFPQNTIQQTAAQFKTHIDAVTAALKQLQGNDSLSQDPSFLKDLQGHIVALAQSAKQTIGE